MTRLIAILTATAIGLVAAIGAGKPALAQYPTPGGSVLCQGTVTVPQTGSSFQVIAQVTDIRGQPVSNQLVQFQIISQPGSSAFLSSLSGLTDAGGIAQVTLFTGATPGLIVVKCSAPPPPPPPPVVVQLVPAVQVVAPVQVVPAGQLVAQVQSAVSVLQPPSTGDGGLAANGGAHHGPSEAFILLGLIAALALTTGGLRVASVKRA